VSRLMNLNRASKAAGAIENDEFNVHLFIGGRKYELSRLEGIRPAHFSYLNPPWCLPLSSMVAKGFFGTVNKSRSREGCLKPTLDLTERRRSASDEDSRKKTPCR